MCQARSLHICAMDVRGDNIIARGAMVLNRCLQHDHLATPGAREVVVHPPIFLDEDTGNVAFHASTIG